MKRVIFAILCICLGVSLFAQEKKEYPKPKHMQPAHTEFWLPQPPVVTPGSYVATVEMPVTGKLKKGQAPTAPACTAASDIYVTAPSDAIVLFDGSGLDEWVGPDGAAAGWQVADGVLTIVPGAREIITRRTFHDFQLHIEWSEPLDIEGESQGRGNSGVYLQGRYEIQILDNYHK